jgi:hypothetical protein
MDHEDRLFTGPSDTRSSAREEAERLRLSWQSFLRTANAPANADRTMMELARDMWWAGARAGVEATVPDRCPNPDCTRCVAHEPPCW